MMSRDNSEKYIDISDLWSFVFTCIDFFLYYYELLKKKMLLGQCCTSLLVNEWCHIFFLLLDLEAPFLGKHKVHET